jgi:hypothetical protein
MNNSEITEAKTGRLIEISDNIIGFSFPSIL